MCTYIVEHTFVAGSGKGERGWFPLAKANVSYDHPFHAPVEHALNIDFVDSSGGLTSWVLIRPSSVIPDKNSFCLKAQ